MNRTDRRASFGVDAITRFGSPNHPELAPASSPVLRVRDLHIRFRTREGVVHAVNGVSFDIAEGEVLAIVGESGSGKSVTMLSLLKLLPTPPAEVVSGTVLLEGKDLMALDAERLRKVRGARVGFVFQEPMLSLNPVLTIGYQLIEPLRAHLRISKHTARERAVKLLELVGIPDAENRLRDFPHHFSGGMRQRVMIAIALCCNPKVLIADEPTTALDTTVQAQILDLVKRLRRELGMSVIWITHDLGVVAGLADRVMVLYAGQVVESAGVKELFRHPRHPYTRGLLSTLPTSVAEDSPTRARLSSIPGQPADLLEPPSTCPFAPRCMHAFDRCYRENPVLAPVDLGHDVACFYDVDTGAPRAR